MSFNVIFFFTFNFVGRQITLLNWFISWENYLIYSQERKTEKEKRERGKKFNPKLIVQAIINIREKR